MMVMRVRGHEEIVRVDFRGENEGKGGESARGGVLIAFCGYFR